MEQRQGRKLLSGKGSCLFLRIRQKEYSDGAGGMRHVRADIKANLT